MPFASHAVALLALLPLAGGQSPEALGTFEFQLGPLEEPASAAWSGDAGFLVLEAAAGRVRAYDAKGVQIAAWGKRGSQPGELLDPRGIAVAPEGQVLVADSGNHRVQAFTALGEPGLAFGRFGSAPGEFNDPRGLAVDSERIAVADARNDRVQVFDRKGAPLLQIGGRGAGAGRFRAPLDVAFGPAGRIYVADSDNARVQVFDRDGRFVRAFGDFGLFPGQFSAPCALDFAASRLYVADRDNHRVQVFDAEGLLLYEWGLHALLPREGSGKLHYPDAIAVAADGATALVCESFEDRAQAFGPQAPLAPEDQPPPPERVTTSHFGPGVAASGNLMAAVEPEAATVALYRLEPAEPIEITRCGVHGSRTGQLLRPCDAAIDLTRGEVVVADPGNLRLCAFRIAHDFEKELAFDPNLLRFARALDFERLHALGQDSGARFPIEPAGIAFDASGALLVCDPRNRTVWIVAPDFRVDGRLGAEDAFLRPTDVAVSPVDARRYVVDELAATVLAFDRDGKALGPLQGAAGRLAQPFGVAVGADGKVYVSDAREDALFEFDADGKFVAKLGGPGLGRVEFAKPKGLAVDGAGELIVLDWGNHRGQVLAADGKSLSAFGARLFTRAFRNGR